MDDFLDGSVIWWMSLAGVGIFFVALLVLPLLAIRMPRDYLLRKHEHELSWDSRTRIRRSLSFILRSALGWVLLLGGIPFLILPGPGLTMVFVGVLLAEFPGKRKVIFWLLTRGAVHHTINWFRTRARREPLIVPGRT